MARGPYPNEHSYAVEQEVLRHDDAVINFGEMTACIMLWCTRDFQQGLVERCSVCYTPFGLIADAYEQSSKNKCANCYGTTFEGGIRAILYRPALWAEDVVSEDVRARGYTTVSTGSVQVTSDFNMRDGDYLVRQDGTRWKITAPQVSEISTGFGPTGLQVAPGAMFRVQLEDTTSVSYLIPISQLAIEVDGWAPYMLYPTDSDVVNGPLTIDDYPEIIVDFGGAIDPDTAPVYDGGVP
jgi:hypothetical protein